MPFGPSDPQIPTPSWPVYNAFAQGDCSGLRDYLATDDIGDFGQAMAAVCAASVEGDQAEWEGAEALADADPSTLANDCLAAVVQDLLSRALQWHAEHPGKTPTVQLRSVSGETECGKQDTTDESQEGEEEPPPETEESSPETEGSSPDTTSPSTGTGEASPGSTETSPTGESSETTE